MSILDKIPGDGFKTIIGAVITFAAVAVPAYQAEPTDWTLIIGAFGVLLGALGIVHKAEKAGNLAHKRGGTPPNVAAVPKVAAPALLVGALLLVGCATPGAAPLPSPGSAGAAGGAQTPIQGAQNIGESQAQVPSESVSTGGNVMWYFASQTSSTTLESLITLATEQNWSPDHFVAAAQALNGAPENVTITTANVEGGESSATAIGTGTGGTSGSAGNSGGP